MEHDEGRLEAAALISEVVERYMAAIAIPLMQHMTSQPDSVGLVKRLVDLRVTLWYAESLLTLYDTGLDFSIGSRLDVEHPGSIVGVIRDFTELPTDFGTPEDIDRIKRIKAKAARSVARTSRMHDSLGKEGR